MATATSKHPASRLDLLVDPEGLHAWLENIRKHHLDGAGYKYEAAQMLWDDLKNKPGVADRRLLFGLDHRSVLNKFVKHIRTSGAYEEEAARHLAAAWNLFLTMYSDQGVHRTKGFDPYK
jgi:hypothetical protein